MAGKHKLQELSPKHRRMAFYIAHGFAHEKVAAKFDVSADTVNRLSQDKLFADEVLRVERIIEERSIVIIEDAQQPLYQALKKMNRRLARIAVSDETPDRVALSAIELANRIVKPSLQKDDEGRKRIPELKINVHNNSDGPKLSVVEGGA